MTRITVACLDSRGEVAPMPGAAELFRACRAAGIKVCLATGFSPVTRDALVAALGWANLVNVLTGRSTRQELEAVPGTASLPGEPLVLDSIADLLPHLGS